MRTGVEGAGREDSEPLEFWKSSNDRFIIKTLVNAWNIDQLYVVLFIPDGRQTQVEQPREKKIIKFPSTSRFPISCL